MFFVDDGSEGGSTNYMNMDLSIPAAQHPSALGVSTPVGLPASSGDPYMDMSPGPSSGSQLGTDHLTVSFAVSWEVMCEDIYTTKFQCRDVAYDIFLPVCARAVDLTCIFLSWFTRESM